ncbi:MAG: hypothetical protein ICCCNLDF_02562 [Planctomycetes bacterium]|nr:hypothetical protein [Planctomycetota bacterium]
MKNLMKLAPMVLVVLAMSACGGGGGGTTDPKSIADDFMKKFLAKDFDSIEALTYTEFEDESALGEVRKWRIDEKYDLWKEYKARLEGDNGMDPKSKSGIDGEEAWKNMSKGKGYALRRGLYKLYANDDLDKRLEMTWACAEGGYELKEEGHGEAEFFFMNGYGDSVKINCVRINNLWYLRSFNVGMEKELPKKPKEE